MIKSILPIALLSAAVISFSSCKSGDGFKKNEHGLEYRIVKDEKGDKHPVVGDIVEMHILVRCDTAVLLDSRKANNGKPIQFPMPAPAFKGDISEGFLMLTAGDSAVFRISVDTLKKGGAQLLPWMKAGDKIEYDVVLVSIKSQQQMQQEQQAHSSEQKATDEKLLQDYLTKNGIQATKTASGLYYMIEKEGSGATAQPGQAVTVNYTGRTLDGNAFDSNEDPKFQHTDPFTFTLGRGQVIPGWDEGIALFKKGTKGKLFIPSTMAYGQNSPSPAIPADAILTFDIEVKDIKDAAPQGQPSMQAPQIK
jgi:FKBP-type peptidyl-prolyl cis-trans isomerase FkpA